MKFKARETFLYGEMASGADQIGRRMVTSRGLEGVVVAGTALTITVEFSLSLWQAVGYWLRRWHRAADFRASPSGKFALRWADETGA